METIEAKIINNTTYSYGFPLGEDQSETIILRENYISQIEAALKKNIHVLFIEGEEDSGKTILSALYAKLYSETCISIFFNPHNDLDYEMGYYCTNFVHQAQQILGEEMDNSSEVVTLEDYRHYKFPLLKYSKGKKEPIVILVDGLENKLGDPDNFYNKLLNAIPFGEKTFKIILTGNREKHLKDHPRLRKLNSESVSLTGFSNPEIKEYLGELYKSDFDIYGITKGLPGRLKTLKRLLIEGSMSIEEIIDSTDYSHWLELDCSVINLNDPKENSIVSLLTLSENAYTSNEVLNICEISESKLQNFLGRQTILFINSDHIKFVSNAHKKYLEGQLRNNKKNVTEMLIRYYSTLENKNSLIELPKLYAMSRKWEKVIQILDEKYLPQIIERTGSLKLVNESLDLGIKAAQKMDEYSQLWRYSIQGSIVNELDNFQFWESEIKARISVNNFAGAITLAESAVLNVDRLRLLALIAKQQKELHKRVDEELIKLIKDLYEITDLFDVGEKIYDIVADLLYSIPNLAIEIIEKSSGNTSDEGINDWIITKLSVAAIDSDLKEKGQNNIKDSKKLEALQSLNNPMVKKINKAIAFLVGNYSSIKVIEEVNKLSDPEEKLRLLRLWLNNNRRNIENIDKVIGLSLDQLVAASSDEIVNYDILKELSFQLPYIKDKEVQHKLYQRFIALEENVSSMGLTKNKYIYQLNKLHCEIRLEKSNTKRFLDQIVNEINGIKDTLIRLDSFSEVHSKLTTLRKKEFRSTYNFVYGKILELSKELYKETAHQFKVSSYLLSTVGSVNPELSIKICSLINTQDRREKSRLLTLDAYLDNNLKHVKFNLLKDIEDSFEYELSKESSCLSILERYSDAKSLHYKVIQDLFYYINKLDSFKNPNKKLYGLILSYKIISKNDKWKERLGKEKEKKIINAWNQIEAEWEKVDSGFFICTQLSGINEGFSKYIFEKSEAIKNESWIDSELVAHTYTLSLKVIIEAYGALLKAAHNVRKDYTILEDLISRIPSEIRKVELWSEIGFQAYILSNKIGVDIKNDHILPLISSLKDRGYNLDDLNESLMILYLYEPQIAIEFILQNSEFSQNKIYSSLCDFYLSGRNPFEIYENKVHKYKCNFSDLKNATKVAEKINDDSELHHNIDQICNAILDSKRSISETQQSQLVQELENLIDNKLPDLNNIKHDGYKILSKLKVGLVKKQINPKEYWPQLILDAQNIPNISDSLFIESVMLDEIPFSKMNNGKDERIKLFNSIIHKLESLSVNYEFIQRVIDLTDRMHSYNPTKWKEVVNRAFSLSGELNGGREVYNSQRNIIDSMYRLDPDFAKGLVRTLDKNTKSNNIDKLLNDHYKSLEIADRIKNSKEVQDREIENSKILVKSVVSALRSLNSDMSSPKKIKEISNFLIHGIKLSLHEVFPIYIYYIANCSKMYNEAKSDGKLDDIHINNFREAVNATNLIQILSHRRKESELSTRKFFIDKEFTTQKLLRAGTREEAFNFIRDWMINHVEDFIIIADPYFEKEDLEILKLLMVALNGSDINIDILGSRDGNNLEIEENFKSYWKKSSDQLPPFTNITFCWVPENHNDSPFHDRWIITKNSGIKIGTSINSLGHNKDSEISVLKPTEALNIQENTLSEYILRRKREHNNQRIQYKSFNL